MSSTTNVATNPTAAPVAPRGLAVAPLTSRFPICADPLTVTTAQRHFALRLRGLPEITNVRKYFASVVVENVKVVCILPDGTNTFVLAVLPSGVAAPVDGASAIKIPGRRFLVQNKQTKSVVEVNFGPSDLSGVETDLAVDSVRAGWPVVYAGHSYKVASDDKDVATLGIVHVEVTLACGGRGTGLTPDDDGGL